MRYNLIYNELMEFRKALVRVKSNDGLFELHHIIPRSLGGNNEKENLVLLTPREHYLAHWLLYKIHTGQDKARMAKAWFMMAQKPDHNIRKKVSSRQYDIIKKALSESCKGEGNPMYGKKPWNKGMKGEYNLGPLWNDEQKAAISKRQLGENNSMYGKTPWNKGKSYTMIDLVGEEKAKEMSANTSRWMTGHIVTNATRKKLSIAHTGKTLSEETKRKLSEINKGKTIPRDIVEKVAAQLRGRKHKLATCPHCDTTGGHSAMYRWHFDNCKSITT